MTVKVDSRVSGNEGPEAVEEQRIAVSPGESDAKISRKTQISVTESGSCSKAKERKGGHREPPRH